MDADLAICAAVSIEDPALALIAQNIDEEYNLILEEVRRDPDQKSVFPPSLSPYQSKLCEMRIEGGV